MTHPVQMSTLGVSVVCRNVCVLLLHPADEADNFARKRFLCWIIYFVFDTFSYYVTHIYCTSGTVWYIWARYQWMICCFSSTIISFTKERLIFPLIWRQIWESWECVGSDKLTWKNPKSLKVKEMQHPVTMATDSPGCLYTMGGRGERQRLFAAWMGINYSTT